MKRYLYIASCFLFFNLLISGCSTNYIGMSENEFWNVYEGRIKIKTDSSYIYQVEMFDTEAEYKKIDILDEPKVTSNFTRILSVNDEGNFDTSLFYTVRIVQENEGYGRITKPINKELYLMVDKKPFVYDIHFINVKYFPPKRIIDYEYRYGYYLCDVMCKVSFKEFVRIANAITLEGYLFVNTTVVQINKSIDGRIKFTSSERPGDSQIINRFYNTNPRKQH